MAGMFFFLRSDSGSIPYVTYRPEYRHIHEPCEHGEWVVLRANMERRACQMAEWIIENKATVRAAARRFGVSKN